MLGSVLTALVGTITFLGGLFSGDFGLAAIGFLAGALGLLGVFLESKAK